MIAAVRCGWCGGTEIAAKLVPPLAPDGVFAACTAHCDDEFPRLLGWARFCAWVAS